MSFEYWFALAAGAILGIGASYVAWYINFHRIRPHANFSIEIAKRQFGYRTTVYQVAFENAGRRRMVDINIVVRIGIKNYKGAGGWAYHAIKTNASQIPDLSSGEERRRLVRVFDSREKIQFVDVPSRSIRKAMEACTSLEELLALGEDGNVQVHVFGYDEFSGTRRHLPSKKYKIHDIRTGKFSGLDVVQESSKYPVKTAEDAL